MRVFEGRWWVGEVPGRPRAAAVRCEQWLRLGVAPPAPLRGAFRGALAKKAGQSLGELASRAAWAAAGEGGCTEASVSAARAAWGLPAPRDAPSSGAASPLSVAALASRSESSEASDASSARARRRARGARAPKARPRPPTSPPWRRASRRSPSARRARASRRSGRPPPARPRPPPPLPAAWPPAPRRPPRARRAGGWRRRRRARSRCAAAAASRREARGRGEGARGRSPRAPSTSPRLPTRHRILSSDTRERRATGERGETARRRPPPNERPLHTPLPPATAAPAIRCARPRGGAPKKTHCEPPFLFFPSTPPPPSEIRRAARPPHPPMQTAFCGERRCRGVEGWWRASRGAAACAAAGGRRRPAAVGRSPFPPPPPSTAVARARSGRGVTGGRGRRRGPQGLVLWRSAAAALPAAASPTLPPSRHPSIEAAPSDDTGRRGQTPPPALGGCHRWWLLGAAGPGRGRGALKGGGTRGEGGA